MRKRTMKRLLGMTLALCLIAGCGQSGGEGAESVQEAAESTVQATEEESNGEKDTFQIAVTKHALSTTDDFNEMEAFKMAEEATGVHIEWIYVQGETADEKISTMMSADPPDAFLGLMNESRIGTNMDLFVDLSGMLKEYAPHVAADYEAAQDGKGMELVTWPDGSIRSLMTSLEVNYENDPDGIMMINKNWLDQLGLSIPETTDELYEVLCAFRDNDMNGNGDPGDEIPLELCENNWAAHVLNMANPWGISGKSSTNVSHFYKVQDGVVMPTLDTEEFRAFLEYMNRLASEGLMDVEAFTQTNDQYYAKLKSGAVGVWFAWTPYSVMSEELSEQYVTMRIPSADGITPVKSGERNRLYANRTGFAITTACEKPERLLEWWDYLSSSTEIKWTMRFGPQGGYWDINDEGTVYLKTPENLTDTFTIENYKYTYGMVDACTFIRADEACEVDEEVAFTTWYRIDSVDQVWDQLATEYTPARFVDGEKTDERTFMETELTPYVDNFIATSIVDGIDDAKWEAHLSQLEALQYYDWIQWYQDYTDGKF